MYLNFKHISRLAPLALAMCSANLAIGQGSGLTFTKAFQFSQAALGVNFNLNSLSAASTTQISTTLALMTRSLPES